MTTATPDTKLGRYTTPEDGLQELLHRLECRAVEGALSLSRELAARWPDHKEVQHYADVLQPLVARSLPATDRFRTERAWARDHGWNYPDRWLAIYGDALIAEAATGQELRQMIQDHPHAKDIMVYYESPPMPRT